MELEALSWELSVCKVGDVTDIELSNDVVFIGKTDEEISLVCLTSDVPKNTLSREDGWKGFRIVGTLDFSLVGILSKITGILADHKIGIFAISTYNTDYVLTKKENFDSALKVLAEEGYRIKK